MCVLLFSCPSVGFQGLILLAVPLGSGVTEGPLRRALPIFLMSLVAFEVQGGQNRVRHVQNHPWEASNAPGTDLQFEHRDKNILTRVPWNLMFFLVFFCFSLVFPRKPSKPSIYY